MASFLALGVQEKNRRGFKEVMKMAFKHTFVLCNINFKIQLTVELLPTI